MNFIPSRLVLFLNLAAFVTLFFSCTKITNTNIGSRLFPPIDGVTTKDTILDVITKNVNFDTVAVGFSDDHVLGYISNDPLFGTTSAGINFQVDLPYADYSFGADKNTLKFDSAVLSLKYTGLWGDSMKPLAIHVYEMDPENLFAADSSYPNTKSFEKGMEITANNVPKNVDITTLNDPDTIQTNSQYYEDATGQIRIQLSQAFGQKLLNQFDSTNAYVDDSTFHNYLKGFIIEVEQHGPTNALVRINLADTGTRLSLYYRFPSTTSASGEDTAVRRFTASSLSCASSNTITRNYSNTPIPTVVPSNANPQDSILYIQTSPGIYAKIQIPGLSGLPNMIVHRAELLMQQIPDATSSLDALFTAPNLFVAAYSKDSAKRFAIPNDIVYSSGVISNLTSFGVHPIAKTDLITGNAQSTYSFDLSRYTQGIVTRKDSTYDLILWAPYNYYMSNVEATPYTYPISTPALNPVAIGRVRLGGGNNTQYRMRLHVVYSLP